MTAARRGLGYLEGRPESAVAADRHDRQTVGAAVPRQLNRGSPAEVASLDREFLAHSDGRRCGRDRGTRRRGSRKPGDDECRQQEDDRDRREDVDQPARRLPWRRFRPVAISWVRDSNVSHDARPLRKGPRRRARAPKESTRDGNG